MVTVNLDSLCLGIIYLAMAIAIIIILADASHGNRTDHEGDKTIIRKK